jgi:threonine dehydrogenase-like Zn-dependent dehydrogenase
LEIIEYPLPRVEKGCVLVKITCCTICGSDLHTWLGGEAVRCRASWAMKSLSWERE